MSGDRSEGDPMVMLPAPATTKAPADRFTGDVWVDGITEGADPGAATLATVHFSPGTRTAWHCHGAGQTLYVTEGHGLVCSRDGRVILMGPGDTVHTPPGTWHWHGSAPDAFMTHLALSVAGGGVEWGDHVTDDEYGSAIRTGEAQRSPR